MSDPKTPYLPESMQDSHGAAVMLSQLQLNQGRNKQTVAAGREMLTT
jgi:hypothetical protein